MFNRMSKTVKKLALVATVGILVVGLFAGCGNEESKEKVLTFGAETTFPPFEFSENDQYVGFDMDLTKALAEKMGYKYQFKSMGFDALVPALQSKDIDVIASGMNQTPEREKAINFSDSYYDDGGFSIITRKDNTDIKDFDSLANKRIVVQIGTVPVEMAHKIPGTTVKEVDGNSQMFMELQAGTVDAAILDTAVAKYYLAQGASKDLKLTGQPTDSPGIAMGVRKDDKELLQQINKALKELKEDGTYQKIYEKWFGPIK